MKKYNLYADTIALIEKSGLSVKQIAALTGLKQNWLYKVLEGRIKEPSVHKFQAIYDELSKMKMAA